jgi:hypothetical protein
MSKMKIVLVGCAMLVALTTVASAEREGCPHGCLGSPAVTECPGGPGCLETPFVSACLGPNCYTAESPNGGRGRISDREACPNGICASAAWQRCGTGNCRASTPVAACIGSACRTADERTGGPGRTGGLNPNAVSGGTSGSGIAAEGQAAMCPVQPCGAVVR